MRNQALALTVLCIAAAGCGPGAMDHRPLTPSQAVQDVDSGAILAAPDSIGAPLTGAWACSDTCFASGASGQLPNAPHDIATTSGPKGDGDVEVATWRGELGPGVTAFALPVAVGPDASQVSVRVKIDGVARAVPTVGSDAWHFVRVAVSASERGRPLEIEIRDRGANWGQWVAAGAPHALREGA